MATVHISLTEAKQNLGELVKRSAYGGERFILEFRGKPQAAIVSYEDLERLVSLTKKPTPQAEVLERLRVLGEQIAARTDERFDSVEDVRRLRQERDDHLSGLH